MMPTVSVIIPSYNHEKYIRQCIQSVLNQTFQDFEIIITDDGSSDRTVEFIEKFTDPRIKLFKNPTNRGASVTANTCIMNSRGKYIAMLSSDDVWYPEKLSVQVEYLDRHPEIAVVFGNVTWIDGFGDPLKANFLYKNIFTAINRNRFEWLRHFFKVGNCLCHPTSLIRREKYLDVGLLNPSLANLPDFDLWIRLCLKYDIHVIDQPLIYFRRINEQDNASGDNLRNHIRSRFEYKQLLSHYLKIIDPKELLLIFPEAQQYGDISPEVIPYFLSRIAITSGNDFMMLWGLENIYSLMKIEKIARKLEKQCGFNYIDFHRLVGDCDAFKISLTPINAIHPIQLNNKAGKLQIFKRSYKKYFNDIFSIFHAFLSVTIGFLRNIFQLFTK